MSGIDTVPSSVRLTDEEIGILVERLINGDESVTPKIMLAHYGLIISVARKFSICRNKNFDDCLDCAIEALGLAITRFPSRCHNKRITPYIMTYVWFSLVKEFRRRPTCELTEESRLTFDKFITLEIREIVELSVKSEEDQIILNGVIEGQKLSEIAELINRSVPYVQTKRARLFDRFQYFWTKDN